MTVARQTSLLAAGAASISAAIIAFPLAVFGPEAQGWLLAARYTARFSFVTFLAAFLGPRWMRTRLGENERGLILAFGAAHGVHLVALTTYRLVDGSIPATSGLVVGGLGYALLTVLVLLLVRGTTSNAFRSGVLHYLLGVFVLTYALKISTPDQHWAGIGGAVAGGIALVLRQVAGRVTREVPQEA